MNVDWLIRKDFGRPIARILLVAGLTLAGVLAFRDFPGDGIPSWEVRTVTIQWIALGLVLVAASAYLVLSRTRPDSSATERRD